MKFYDRKNRNICGRLDRLCSINAKRVTDEGPARIIRVAINLQHALLSEHVWTLGTVFGLSASRAMPILISTVHRNTFLFFSALKLNELGLYAPARVLLRPIFEGMIIAKYCAVSGDSQLLARWSNGEAVNLSGEVLRKLERPDPSELRGFWKHLCQYSHATVYAQQNRPTLEVDHVWETMWLIIILLQMNYHLIGRHLVTRGMAYYSELYGHQEQARQDRQRLNSLLRDCRQLLPVESRRLIRDYKATWVLRERKLLDKTVHRTTAAISIDHG